MTDAKRAEAYRVAAAYLETRTLPEGIAQDVLRNVADFLDPPKPAIDTTLRGPVWKEYAPGYYSIHYARGDGLWVNKPFVGVPERTWEDVIKAGHPLHPVTPSDSGFRIRRWDEWTDEEQRRTVQLWQGKLFPDFFEPMINLAIDIATKQEDV